MKTALIALAYLSSVANACYDDWRTLADDVESSEEGGKFVVCPGTVLIPETVLSGGEYFTDIWFYESGIQLLCGEDGSYDNDCIFRGGRSHLYVPDDDIQDIYVSGFRFADANETSIMLYGTPSSTVTFHDCVWSGNSGNEGGAVNIWHTYDARGQAMSARFEKCEFHNNDAEDGAVLVEGGTVVFKQCQFKENLGGWAIELQLDTEATIYNTCFDDNQGPVFVYPGSVLLESKDNYASNNNFDDYDCEGAWQDQDDICLDFTATTCRSDEDSSSAFSKTINTTIITITSLVVSAFIMA